jgi:hypothetical protein
MTSPVRGDPGRTRPPPGGVRPSFEAINEGGVRPPRLRLDLNAGTLWNLPDWSAAPKHDLYAGLAAAGYEGLQAYAPEPAAIAAGLAMTGMARALEPAALDAFAAQHKAWGFQATTLHLGDGFETDAEMDRFAAAALEAQARHAHPLFVETHRATITQDMRRTLDLVARFPDLRFNADLSHWYTGHELTYGDVQAKIDRLAPVLERVRYLHGRIGTSCAMQAPLGSAETAEALGHFRTLWARCFEGFLRAAFAGGRRRLRAGTSAGAGGVRRQDPPPELRAHRPRRPGRNGSLGGGARPLRHRPPVLRGRR